MKSILYIPCVALILLCSPGIFGQSTEKDGLLIQGEVLTPLSLDLDQIREMPSQTLQLMDHAEV